MKPLFTEAGRPEGFVDGDEESLREALVRAREENLNLRDEAVGARAAAAQARKDHDATFYLLDTTTRQLNELKAALGFGPDAEVADIVHAMKFSAVGPATRPPGKTAGRR